jgi:hypothetical protein
MTPSPDLSDPLEPDEVGRLFDTVRRELHARRIANAAEAAQELLDKHPDSTTAHELMGDVLAAQGKRAQAKEEYKRALELEPVNADAERKFAEMALVVGQSERTRQMLVAGDLEGLRGAVRKDSGAAAARSLFFPGLGQLYNGEYEKGLAAVLVAFPFFGLAVWGVSAFIGAAAPETSQYTRVPMSTPQVIGAIVGIVGYGALLVWSVWDAYRGGTAGSPGDGSLPPRK